jgi:hypothetical protein
VAAGGCWLGNIKTSLAGNYHAFAFRKHAHCHLVKMLYPFKDRFDLRAIPLRLRQAASETSPYLQRRVRVAEALASPSRSLL